MKVKPSLCIFQLRAVKAIVHDCLTCTCSHHFCAQVDDDRNRRSLPCLAIFLHQRPLQEIVKNRPYLESNVHGSHCSLNPYTRIRILAEIQLSRMMVER